MIPNRSLAYLFSLLFSLGIFSLYRLLFYLFHRGVFAPFSAGDVFSSFVLGLRFDLHIAAAFLAGPYLILHLPLPWTRMRRFALLLHWAAFPFLLLSILLLTVDLYYYREAGRRLSNEVFSLGNDVRSSVQMMAHYRAGLVLFLGVGLLAFFAWRIISSRMLAVGRAPTLRRQSAFLALFLVATGLGVRGSLGRCPIHLSHAFTLGATELGHLALNPVFTVVKSYSAGRLETVNFMPEDQAFQNVQALLGIERENLPDPRYPVFRSNKGDALPPARPNIVILIIESFGSRHLGVQGSSFDTTPNFDRLAEGGLFFDEFYSVGVRTTEGLTAILLGMPTMRQTTNRNVSALSGFLTQNAYRGLATALGERGYRSVFMQGGKADTFRLEELASLAGFDRYLSKEDFALSEAETESEWGVWDHVMLGRLKETVGRMPEPFLAVWFSITNHPPYTLPPGYKTRFGEEHPDRDLLNSISYTDESLGDFMRSVETEPYFKRTVFLILADHASRSIETLRDRFHIPLLVYAPGLIDPGISERVGSQVSIIPTVLDLAGVQGVHHALGRSLLEEGGAWFAPVNLAPGFGWFEDGRFLSIGPDGSLVSVYDYRKGLYLDARGVDLRVPLSYFQAANNLLLGNRLASNRAKPKAP